MSYIMAKDAQVQKRPSMISFRASADEIARVDAMVRMMRRKYPFMNKSDVLRELVGLTNAGLASEMRSWLAFDEPNDVFADPEPGLFSAPDHKLPKRSERSVLMKRSGQGPSQDQESTESKQKDIHAAVRAIRREQQQRKKSK